MSQFIKCILLFEWNSSWRFYLTGIFPATYIICIVLRHIITQNFIFFFITVIIWIWWRILLCRVIIRIEILWLPICSDKTSSFSKISCKIYMLFSSLNFSFETAASLTPSFQKLLCLFISTFFSNFFVLMHIPHRFEFLLSCLTRWVIVLVVWTTCELVLSFKEDLFFTRIKSFKWVFARGTFSLGETNWFIGHFLVFFLLLSCHFQIIIK